MRHLFLLPLIALAASVRAESFTLLIFEPAAKIAARPSAPALRGYRQTSARDPAAARAWAAGAPRSEIRPNPLMKKESRP